jgi:hypothetical protein
MRFDDDSWELLTREGGPITYNERSVIEDMIEDRDGNVWILTESEGASAGMAPAGPIWTTRP